MKNSGLKLIILPPPYRYQFNPHLLRDEPVTNILTKSLTVFPSPDFSLCLHLLPSYILSPPSSSNNPSSNPTPGDAPLSEAVQKLTILNNLLSGAKYREFWQTLDKDDLYADLIADVGGFEELMRVRIAVTVGQSCREVERGVLEGWCMFPPPLFSSSLDFYLLVADGSGKCYSRTHRAPVRALRPRSLWLGRG